MPKSTIHQILQLLIFQTIFKTVIANQKCYLTNGKEADSSFQPCFPSQENSPCCSLAKSNETPNDICLSGGVCYIQDPNFRGLLRQGACTDSTWKSGQCPGLADDGKRWLCSSRDWQTMAFNFGVYLLTSAPLNIASDATLYVIPCPVQGRGFWCGSVNGSDCCDNAVRLDMGQMINVTVTSISDSVSSSFASSESSVSMSTSSSSSAPTSASTSTSTLNTSSKKGDSEDSSVGTCTSGSTCPASHTTAISAGIGGGLGACLLAAIITILLQRRIYRKNMRQKEAMFDEIVAAGSQQHLVYPAYPEREKVFPAELGPRATRIHEVDGNRLNEFWDGLDGWSHCWLRGVLCCGVFVSFFVNTIEPGYFEGCFLLGSFGAMREIHFYSDLWWLHLQV